MSDPISLLNAVDALTKPVAQSRWMETTHDHEWLPLRRERSKDEIRDLKAAGEKRPERTELTGEWWCLWCDEVVAVMEWELPSTVLVRRKDAPLLDQLEAAVVSDLGQGGGKSAKREQLPLDASALQLSIRIRKGVLEWLTALGARAGGELTLSQLVRSWHALQLATMSDTSEQLKALRRWAGEIRGLLDPEPHPDIPGICPRCQFAFVITDDDVRQRALQGVDGATYEKVSVTCQVCGTRWQGRDELLELANATRRLEGAPELESPPLIGYI